MSAYLLLPPGPSHLQNLTPKFRILNVFWTWSVSKGKTYQFEFFNWFSNLKNLVIWNGFKNVWNDPNDIENSYFFQKNYKKSPRGRPQNPSLWYVWVQLLCSSRLPTKTILEKKLTFGSSPFTGSTVVPNLFLPVAHFHFENFPWPTSQSIAQELDPNFHQSWIRLKRFFGPPRTCDLKKKKGSSPKFKQFFRSKTGDLQIKKQTRQLAIHCNFLRAFWQCHGINSSPCKYDFFKPKCSVATQNALRPIGGPWPTGWKPLCSKIQVICKPRPRLQILHFTISLSQKHSLFSKNFDNVIACDLRFGLPLH